MPEAPFHTPFGGMLTTGLPVVVEAPARWPAPTRYAATVRAVIPCYNRQADLDQILRDLSALELQTGAGPIDLAVTVVDNASTPALNVPAGSPVRLLRLEENTGGSGGFNAGMHARLTEWERPALDTDYLWLVDSDARVRPDTLRLLIEALDARPDLVAVGPALADPATGEVFEVGGRVNRRDGTYGPVHEHLPAALEPVLCDYVASCCALVRRGAVERTGLMPDRFINGDDVEWFIRLARGTGRRVACVPRAVAMHPRFDRFPTWTRAYATRNSLGPAAALGLGFAARLRCALVNVGRAVNQAMMARMDLAELHLAGLRAAAAGQTTGRISDLPTAEAFHPFVGLESALKEHRHISGERERIWIHPALDLPRASMEELCRLLKPVRIQPGEPGVRRQSARAGLLGALRRAVLGPPHDIAVVPAEGRPSSWLRGRLIVEVVPEGFVVRRTARLSIVCDALATAARGVFPALRATLRHGPESGPAPCAPPRRSQAPAPTATISVLVLSYNRRAALEKTLRRLSEDPALRGAEIIVADNGSQDGSVSMVKERFARAQVLENRENLGVTAFNRAAELARGELLLVLDDDAYPEPGALTAAVEALARDEDIGAVALHPRHPEDGRSEWPYATSISEDWPVMGCGNLVRRADWLAVGGYEGSFFLYRNDTDLAMKLLGAGRKVVFNPAWVVWHDSPAAARKSARWFELATRNWLWLARRHGRALTGLLGALLGWAWAHRLAGASPAMHWRVLKGAWAGIVRRPAPLPETVRPDGRAFARLIGLQLSSRGRRTGSATQTPAPVPTALTGAERAGRNGTIDSSSDRHSAYK